MESRKDKSLIVIKGEEFKLNLKEQIDESDIFYDQYLEAAEMLNDIVTINEDESGVDMSLSGIALSLLVPYLRPFWTNL